MKKILITLLFAALPAAADNPPPRPPAGSGSSTCPRCCCFSRKEVCHPDCSRMPNLKGTVEISTSCLSRQEVEKLEELIGDLNSSASWMNAACVHLCGATSRAGAPARHKH